MGAIGLLLIAIKIFYWGLILFCIMSFIRTPATEPINRFLDNIYKPILDPISKLLAPVQKNIGLDFSPILLIFLLNFITRNLSNSSF